MSNFSWEILNLQRIKYLLTEEKILHWTKARTFFSLAGDFFIFSILVSWEGVYKRTTSADKFLLFFSELIHCDQNITIGRKGDEHTKIIKKNNMQTFSVLYSKENYWNTMLYVWWKYIFTTVSVSLGKLFSPSNWTFINQFLIILVSWILVLGVFVNCIIRLT